MLDRLKRWARTIKRDVHAVYLAARDPRTPWYAKALALCIAGYALSPIDLIPDFIPVLGYLDDAIIVPLGILAVVKMIPPELMAEHRAAAALAGELRTVARDSGGHGRDRARHGECDAAARLEGAVTSPDRMERRSIVG
ncbi:YkvA family protein [Mesorhizobium sp. KR9-304]|uniref:YkvA family protein n=1 Tax=Mesorhizobium sp. KR9-304 TaxID=3156614 RepID=UPI0032B3EDC2